VGQQSSPFASCKDKIDESDLLKGPFIPDTYAVLVGAFLAVGFWVLGAGFDLGLAAFFFGLSGGLSTFSLSETTFFRFAGLPAFQSASSSCSTRRLFLCEGDGSLPDGIRGFGVAFAVGCFTVASLRTGFARLRGLSSGSVKGSSSMTCCFFIVVDA
jgi:hypothetical protein